MRGIQLLCGVVAESMAQGPSKRMLLDYVESSMHVMPPASTGAQRLALRRRRREAGSTGDSSMGGEHPLTNRVAGLLGAPEGGYKGASNGSPFDPSESERSGDESDFGEVPPPPFTNRRAVSA